jgi:hypothetical protein
LGQDQEEEIKLLCEEEIASWRSRPTMKSLRSLNIAPQKKGTSTAGRKFVPGYVQTSAWTWRACYDPVGGLVLYLPFRLLILHKNTFHHSSNQ